MSVNALQQLSKLKKTRIALFADFYGENSPQWLISASQHKSLNTGLGRDM